jgi:aminopeptidase N
MDAARAGGVYTRAAVRFAALPFRRARATSSATDPFAIDHLALEIALDVAAGAFARPRRSTSGASIPRSTELALDAVGFDVREVTVDGEKGRDMAVRRQVLGSVGSRATRARGSSSRTARRRAAASTSSSPTSTIPDRPRQVWSQCQEEDARYWIPCHDSPHVKMTTEITVRVPAGWYALSNGALVSNDKPKDRRLDVPLEDDEPHPSYLLTLVAGEFARSTDEVKIGDREVPLSYLVPASDARATGAHVRPHARDDRALQRSHRRRPTRGTSTRRSS